MKTPEISNEITRIKERIAILSNIVERHELGACDTANCAILEVRSHDPRLNKLELKIKAMAKKIVKLESLAQKQGKIIDGFLKVIRKPA